MPKIAIIDNTAEDAARILRLLQQIQPTSVIHVYKSISAFLSTKTTYKFLLLDINLDEEDGIDQSPKCKQYAAFIIYISTIKDRMQEAFAKNVIGYILKQDDDETISNTLTKLIQQNTEKYLTLKTIYTYQNIPISSIYKITRENRKIFVYLKSSTIRIYECNLKDIYEQCKDCMIWIDRSIMVNYKHITSFNDTEIIFDNSTKEQVKTRRKKEAFNDYIQKLFYNI